MNIDSSVYPSSSRPNPKIYASKGITRYLKRLMRQRFVKSELIIEHIPNGKIIVADKENCYGVFDRNHRFVKRSLQLRGKGQLIPTAVSPENLSVQDVDAVYLGNIDHVFGHYILEHWCRAYAFLDKKYRAMKFVLINDMRYDPVPRFVTELACFLGIPSENFLIITQSVQFANVYVPECGFRLIRYSSKKFGELYAKIAENIPKSARFDKIYLSRAALKTRKTYGEEKVQQIFEKNGYHIVYPEQLPLDEQISLMKNCRSLAGCAGTALHLALFMPAGGTVIQIRRNTLKDGNCGTQYLITEAKELGIIYIDASIEKYKTRHGEDKAQIIGVNRNMKRFFDDEGFTCSPDDWMFDSRAWDEYLQADKKLMEERRKKYNGKSERQVRIMDKTVKLMACFIINRHRRVAFRTRLRKAWKLI